MLLSYLWHSLILPLFLILSAVVDPFPYVSVLLFAGAPANTRRGRNTRDKKNNIKLYPSKMLPI